MIKEIFRDTCVVVAFACLCGYFVSDSIKALKKEEYFHFGTALALAVYEATNIVKLAWF